MNWFMPAFVRSNPDSGGGISDELGTRLCSRSSKNERNSSRIRSPSTTGVYRRTSVAQAAVGSSGPGSSIVAASSSARSSRSRSSIARLPSSIDSATSLDRSIRPPFASRASVAGLTLFAWRLAHREVRTAPVAPAPNPSATQKPRRMSGRRRAWRRRLLRLPLPERFGGLLHACADAEELHDRARSRVLDQACEALHPPDDPADGIEHPTDPIEVPVGPLDRAFDLTEQGDGLFAHRVHREAGGFPHPERVQEDEAEEKDQQSPEGGQDDQGGLAAGECQERHPLPP